MRLLLTAPLPRWYLLFCKLIGGTMLSTLQAYAFLLVACSSGWKSRRGLAQCAAGDGAGGLMVGSIGLILSVHVRQPEISPGR